MRAAEVELTNATRGAYAQLRKQRWAAACESRAIALWWGQERGLSEVCRGAEEGDVQEALEVSHLLLRTALPSCCKQYNIEPSPRIFHWLKWLV